MGVAGGEEPGEGLGERPGQESVEGESERAERRLATGSVYTIRQICPPGTRCTSRRISSTVRVARTRDGSRPADRRT